MKVKFTFQYEGFWVGIPASARNRRYPSALGS